MCVLVRSTANIEAVGAIGTTSEETTQVVERPSVNLMPYESSDSKDVDKTV